jgi:hypothetical protein
MWHPAPGGTGWPAYGPQYPAAPPQPYAETPAYGAGAAGLGTPYVPQAHPPQFQPPHFQPPQFQPPQRPPRRPRSSPFAGVPPGDFVVDAVTVIALPAILLLHWTVAERAYSRTEVIVACVLCLCATVLPYLSRTGIFGPSWTPAKLRIAKLVAAAPLGLCAATYFVIDAIVGVIDGGPTKFAPAPGAWIAAVVSVLAALPRRSDLIDGGSQGSSRLWAFVLTVTSVALLVCATLALLGVLLGAYRSLSGVLELRALVLLPVTQAVLLGIWLIAVWKVVRRASHGDGAGRLVLAAAGAGALIWTVLAAVGQFSLGAAESLHLPFGGISLTMIAALIAISPSLRRPGDLSGAQPWLTAARGVLGLVVVADLLLVAQIVANVALSGALTAAVFTTLICAGFGAVAADWARQQITLNPMRCRGPVLVASTVQGATGLVSIVVLGSSPNRWEVVTGPQVIAAFALPAAVAAFVTLPTPIRSFFPTAAPVPTNGPPAPAVIAADPATPPHVLYSLAQRDGALWPHIARNPAAPSDLLAWLAQSTDPEVHAVLRARQQMGPPTP